MATNGGELGLWAVLTGGGGAGRRTRVPMLAGDLEMLVAGVDVIGVIAVNDDVEVVAVAAEEGVGVAMT